MSDGLGAGIPGSIQSSNAHSPQVQAMADRAGVNEAVTGMK